MEQLERARGDRLASAARRAGRHEQPGAARQRPAVGGGEVVEGGERGVVPVTPGGEGVLVGW